MVTQFESFNKISITFQCWVALIFFGKEKRKSHLIWLFHRKFTVICVRLQTSFFLLFFFFVFLTLWIYLSFSLFLLLYCQNYTRKYQKLNLFTIYQSTKNTQQNRISWNIWYSFCVFLLLNRHSLRYPNNWFTHENNKFATSLVLPPTNQLAKIYSHFEEEQHEHNNNNKKSFHFDCNWLTTLVYHSNCRQFFFCLFFIHSFLFSVNTIENYKCIH